MIEKFHEAQSDIRIEESGAPFDEFTNNIIVQLQAGGIEDYFADLHWLSGYQDINPTTPPDIMGDFIFNNQEFGTIVINRVAEVLNSGRPVEDAMADAQAEAEELANNLQA